MSGRDTAARLRAQFDAWAQPCQNDLIVPFATHFFPFLQYLLHLVQTC